MCKCGCNKCETVSTALMLNESKAPRTILSEGLKHHIDANRPLTDNFYSAGSKDYFDLIAEARSLYSRGILEFTNKRDIELLTETDQGYFGIYEGKKVPLDFPMLNESGADTSWEDEDGNKITLEDILDMTKNIPQKDYPTEKLSKIVLNWDDNPEEIERIEQVEISKQYPILIMVDEGGKIQWILDGNHRAQKALRSKSKTIPAKLIKPSNLDAKAKKILLGLPIELNEIEIGDVVKIDKAYGGGKGEVKDKKGSFVVVNGSSYHESDVKLIKEYYDEDSDPSEDDIAQAEFGMDYDQLGPNEKEWVRDEYENINNFNRANEGLTIKERINKILEAKFKGKTVDLNKPTRGDSKKFKVYVNSGKKNADGSIKVKKVNFGHGGTTAKKAGQKTMSIRKSNPKARKAFRARHRCDNPGPKTMARYWSCKKW